MIGGSIAGVFYPSLIGAFKSLRPVYKVARSWDAGWKRALRILGFLIAGGAIGVVLALISFATFLGDADNQAKLIGLGAAAYFLAFTAGFTASSAAEELARTPQGPGINSGGNGPTPL